MFKKQDVSHIFGFSRWHSPLPMPFLVKGISWMCSQNPYTRVILKQGFMRPQHPALVDSVKLVWALWHIESCLLRMSESGSKRENKQKQSFHAHLLSGDFSQVHLIWKAIPVAVANAHALKQLEWCFEKNTDSSSIEPHSFSSTNYMRNHSECLAT